MSMLKRAIVPVVILVLVAAAAVTMLHGGDTKTLVAHFPRAVSIYEGSDVRVLGVPVGQVDSVTPDGTDVVVTMSYDANVKVPANAKAVIVAPSVVGDRFIQLTPAYTGGDVIADGADLGTDRTAVPLELDQIYSSIDDLTVALGPNGANRKGALTDLLEVTAKNFGGEGAKFHQTIKDFGKLSQTLDDNKDQLFGSARELEGFIGTLARNDGVVRRFNQSLGNVSSELAGERHELATSLHNLGIALGEVSSFVKQNREVLGRNIKGLDEVSQVLVKRRDELDKILDTAPLALNNLALTYNPDAGTLDTSANFGEILNQVRTDPSTFLCGILQQADKTGALCDLAKQTLQRPAGSGASSGASAGSGGLFDRSLGGLVGGGR